MTSKREWERRARVAEWDARLQRRLAEKRDVYFKAMLDNAVLVAHRTFERDAARATAARLEAQLAAIAAIHRAQPLYDECEEDCPDHGIELNYYTGCPDRITAMVCRYCCLDETGDQTEDCAMYHDHTEHTCPTAAVWANPDEPHPDAEVGT